MFNSKRFFKQLLGYMPSQIIPALSNLGIILILTRFLSVEDYGVYSLLITTANLSVSIFTQWIMQSILFYRPQYKNDNRILEFDGHILKIYFLLIIIFVSLLVFLLPISILFSLDINIIIPLILIILVNSIFVINQTILQSDMRVRIYSFKVSSATLIKLLLIMVISFMLPSNVIFILWAVVLSYFIFVIPQFINLFKNIGSAVKIKKEEWVNFRSFLLEVFHYGVPLLGWFLTTSFISITDRYILAIFESSYEVGLYSANVSIVSSALGLVFSPIIKAIHPIIMNTASNSDDNNKIISNLMSRFSLIFIILGTPVIVTIIILRKEISHLLLGEIYIQGSIIIPLILVGLFLWNLALIGHKGFEVKKNTKDMFKYILIALILNVILNFAFIPLLGILGAGIASLVAYASYPVLIKINSKRNITWKFQWHYTFIFIVLGVLVYIIALVFNDYLTSSNLLIHIITVGLFILCFYTTSSYIVVKLFKIKFK